MDAYALANQAHASVATADFDFGVAECVLLRKGGDKKVNIQPISGFYFVMSDPKWLVIQKSL